MKITIKEETKTNLKFILYSNISFANSLRRILLSEVPMIAIDIIEIKENRTILGDEMIAHRIGLVPIKYAGKLIYKEECDCDGFCQKCSIQFDLKKSNNMDDSNSIVSVTGSDLHTQSSGVQCHNSLIVKLAPGQKVDMVCYAILGNGKTHAKFSPITTVGFTYDKNNKTRGTKLWYEENENKEWPNIDQSEDVDWNAIEEIEMNIEVVEGLGSPREYLMNAIDIFKDKMRDIYQELD